MDTFECIRKRRDIRSYIKKDVPDDTIKKIIEAGRLAPSAMNSQPWHFIVIKNKGTLKELGQFCSSGRFIVDASFAVAVVTDPENKWHEIDGARLFRIWLLPDGMRESGVAGLGQLIEKR